MSKSITLRFRAVNRDIFQAIRDGSKRVETRAATQRFKNITAGDQIICVCESERVTKKVKKATIFKTVEDMLQEYTVKDINPACSTVEELIDMYHSFPGYREKIQSFGLIALELE